MQVYICVPISDGEPDLVPGTFLEAILDDSTPMSLQAGAVRDLVETIEDTLPEAECQKFMEGLTLTGVITVHRENGTYRVETGDFSMVMADVPPEIVELLEGEEDALNS